MYNRRIRKIENRIGKQNPDLLVIPEIEGYRTYKNMLRGNPHRKFVLKISRPMMYHFNSIETDISDKQCILDRIRNARISRLRARGIFPGNENRNSLFSDKETIKTAGQKECKSN
jgi:hypothetical protein